MGVILLPGIENLDPESLCYSIYTQLYQNFFNAQDPGTITEGDATSVRLRNTAYGFAEAIAGGVAGEGSVPGVGVLAAYLKRSGGDMSGPLSADYGFVAGIDNHRLLETYRKPETDAQGQITGYGYSVRITSDLRVEGDNLYFGGQQFITYIGKLGTMFIRYPKMDFSSSSIRALGEMYFGASKNAGVYLSPHAMQFAGHDVYHTGNAGHADADWTMKDATVTGMLTVRGTMTLKNSLTALYGITLGNEGVARLYILGESVEVNADLSLLGAHGIYMLGGAVLSSANGNSVALNAPGGEVLLGPSATTALRLLSPLKDQLGTHVLLTPAGDAYFPGSLRIAHNLGADLLTTYNNNTIDTGVVVHRYLRMGSASGPGLTHVAGNILFTSAVTRTVDGREQKVWHEALIGHKTSESLMAPADNSWNDMFIRTDAHHFHFENPIYGENFIGIARSSTRLEKECLFLTDDHRLQSVQGGIKHYGQALFIDGVSSEFFSSGFSGSGWAVLYNATTGAATATFDDLVVRRRMRVYEMEVQRTRATDGALWISDSCSGDSVVQVD